VIGAGADGRAREGRRHRTDSECRDRTAPGRRGVRVIRPAADLFRTR